MITVVVSGWFFLLVMNETAVQVGPFDTKPQCEQIRKEAIGSFRLRNATSCWYIEPRIQHETPEGEEENGAQH